MSLVGKRVSVAFLSAYALALSFEETIGESSDPDVVGQIQNGTCQANEKMRYVNAKVHNNQCLVFMCL